MDHTKVVQKFTVKAAPEIMSLPHWRRQDGSWQREVMTHRVKLVELETFA